MGCFGACFHGSQITVYQTEGSDRSIGGSRAIPHIENCDTLIKSESRNFFSTIDQFTFLLIIQFKTLFSKAKKFLFTKK